MLHSQALALLSLALVISFFAGCAATNSVVTTPPPASITASPLYDVKVNGKSVFVYPCDVTKIVTEDGKLWDKRHQTGERIPAALTTFDFTGKVEVEVTVRTGAGTPALHQALKSITVRPMRHNITPIITGNVAKFTITTPGQYSIEPNGEIIAPLHLFANAPETDVPNASDPNVKYFGPGDHKLGMYHPPSNTTIYLAAGAIVRGHIHAENVTNVKILGRGILDASKSPHDEQGGPRVNEWGENHRHIRFFKSKNITIDGIVMLDSPTWGIEINHCDNVKVHNVKVITCSGSGDGIDVCSSEDVSVSGSFFRTHDDSLNVKGLTDLGYPGGKNGKQWSSDGVRKPAARIIFKNIVVWNDRAHALMIGPETRTTEIRDVLYENIDIIHALSVHAMGIFSSDAALIRNVHYKNITVEDARVMELMGIRIGKTYVNADDTCGDVRDVYYENIHVLTPGAHSTAYGELPSGGKVENVTYENIRFGDKVVKTAEEMLLHTRGATSGITIK